MKILRRIWKQLARNVNDGLSLWKGFLFVLTSLIITLFYLWTTYTLIIHRVDGIVAEFSSPVSPEELVGYSSDSTETEIDFSRPYRGEYVDEKTVLFSFDRPILLRQFRIYFQRSGQFPSLIRIGVKQGKSEQTISPQELSLAGLRKSYRQNSVDLYALNSDGTAHLESPSFFYFEDIVPLAIAFVVNTFLLILLGAALLKLFAQFRLSDFSLQEWGFVPFICCMFLPQIYFNITLAIAVVAAVWNFSGKEFLNGRLGMMFIGYYFLVLLTFLISSPNLEVKLIEKYTPLVVMPILAACLTRSRLLIFFAAASIVMGVFLFSAALIDLCIIRNLEVLSFDNFTRGIHPVYYSYLVVTGMVWVQYGSGFRGKAVFFFIYIALLVMSGSKLILAGVLLWTMWVSRRWIKVLAVLLSALVLLFFTPLSDRFSSVANLRALSIVREAHIAEPDDPRINGLTLRLILWQEALRFEKWDDLLLGKGVGPASTISYERRLMRRGLTKHMTHNAHSQYLTTYYEMGLVGLIALLSILVYAIKLGQRRSDWVLLGSSYLTCFAMLSESVFERTMGIVLFTMILLLAAKKPATAENKSPLAS